MKAYVFSVILLLAVVFTAQAQSFPPKLFNVEVGTNVYYDIESKFAIFGNDFSSRHSIGTNFFGKLKLPKLEVTYTYTPTSSSDSDNVLLVASGHRGDLELDFGWPVKPLVLAEALHMDLHKWYLLETETPTTDEETEPEIITTMVHDKQNIVHTSGGLGAIYEAPIDTYLKFKVGGAYKFIDQRGYEAAVSIDWFRPSLKFDILASVGAHYNNSYYNWGRSQNYGMFVDLGVQF